VSEFERIIIKVEIGQLKNQKKFIKKADYFPAYKNSIGKL
jgi:hypothetical protein